MKCLECPNDAGSQSVFWCDSCNKKRIERIDSQFRIIEEMMKTRNAK